MSEPAANQALRCIIVTPEETVLDAGADHVVVPLFDGELGVGVGHCAMIGRLGFGELRVRSSKDGADGAFYVDGGFVQVADDVVSVMTNRAKPVGELDTADAEKQLQEALAAPVASGDALTLRQRAIDQARGLLRTAQRQAK